MKIILNLSNDGNDWEHVSDVGHDDVVQNVVVVDDVDDVYTYTLNLIIENFYKFFSAPILFSDD